MPATPPADIQAAAARLAPPAAHVFLAVERDASFGVVAWTLDGRPSALALQWRGGRWQPARAAGLTIRTGPRSVHEPLLLHVRNATAVWIDGRPAQITGYEYVLLSKQRRGMHTAVVFAQRGTNAFARAWSYAVS